MPLKEEDWIAELVEHCTRHMEVVGLDPTGGMWFFFLLLSYQLIFRQSDKTTNLPIINTTN